MAEISSASVINDYLNKGNKKGKTIGYCQKKVNKLSDPLFIKIMF